MGRPRVEAHVSVSSIAFYCAGLRAPGGSRPGCYTRGDSGIPVSGRSVMTTARTNIHELQETRAWLVLLQQRGYLDEPTASAMIGESDEMWHQERPA